MKLTPEEVAECEALKALFAKHAGMSQAAAAEAWGIGNQSNLSHYLNKRQALTLEAATKFAKGMGIAIDEFSPRLAMQARSFSRVANGESPNQLSPAETASVEASGDLEIPILHNGASMGAGEVQHDEDSVSGLRLLPNWVHANLRNCKPEALRFIHGHGDSMAPTYNSGDILLVDTDTKDVKIDGVYVLQAHGRLFIKRVRQRMDGQFEISSDNPAHKTVDTLSGTEQVVVKGRVVWAWNGRKV
jgi:phage repressor protein C with HTH and peptisase S24 domain